MSIASNSACGGAPMPSSIFTNPMKRGMLISPSGWWELLSRPYVEPARGASTSTSEVFSASGRGEDPERLGHSSGRHSGGRRIGAVPPANHRFKGVWLRMLARVGVQRRHLPVERLGDVDVAVGPLHAGHPCLGDRPGLEVGELGERERVARVGVDGAQGRLAGGEMVGMAG